MERTNILIFGSIMTWIIGYYVIGLLNIIYFCKRETKLKYFIFWFVGQELIGLGIVFFSFNDSINNIGGFPIFPWDFGIWIFTMAFSLIYSLIYFLIAHGIISEKNSDL